MDHARCSELLPAYERGELDAPVAAALRGHLETCKDCSLELAGLRALHATAVDPLSGAERSALHQRIAAATGAEDIQRTVGPARGSRFWGRVAPALGGIAVLALLVTGAVLMNGSDGADLGSSGSGGGADEATRTQDAADSGAGGEATAPEAAEAPETDAIWAGEIGEVTERSLSRSVRRQEAPSTDGGGVTRTSLDTSSKYQALNASQDAPANLRDLQAQAGDPTSEQIASCAESVAESLPYPMVPTYGAIAELDGRRVLLLGFRWAEAGQRDLDEFMLWAWPLGDCGAPVFYGSGTSRD